MERRGLAGFTCIEWKGSLPPAPSNAICGGSCFVNASLLNNNPIDNRISRCSKGSIIVSCRGKKCVGSPAKIRRNVLSLAALSLTNETRRSLEGSFPQARETGASGRCKMSAARASRKVVSDFSMAINFHN